MEQDVILAGDIGGTSARLGVFQVNDGNLRLVLRQTLPSREYASIEKIIEEFSRSHSFRISKACFAVAGPVIDGTASTPNLPWTIESRLLADQLELGEVTLLNDLEANAIGISVLPDNQFVSLNSGVPEAHGNAAVISAGTGLGQAGLYWDGKRHKAFACEGGHADFAPNNKLEVELWQYLHAKFGHVSWERVLSGQGLRNIYHFLRAIGHAGGALVQLSSDPAEISPAAISEAGLNRACPTCSLALDLFCAIYGAAAGNLALSMMALGGVYLGGGIAPKIVTRLQSPAFMDAFTAKGRMRQLMERIPVKVVMDEDTALVGAATHARKETGMDFILG